MWKSSQWWSCGGSCVVVVVCVLLRCEAEVLETAVVKLVSNGEAPSSSGSGRRELFYPFGEAAAAAERTTTTSSPPNALQSDWLRRFRSPFGREPLTGRTGDAGSEGSDKLPTEAPAGGWPSWLSPWNPSKQSNGADVSAPPSPQSSSNVSDGGGGGSAPAAVPSPEEVNEDGANEGQRTNTTEKTTGQNRARFQSWWKPNAPQSQPASGEAHQTGGGAAEEQVKNGDSDSSGGDVNKVSADEDKANGNNEGGDGSNNNENYEHNFLPLDFSPFKSNVAALDGCLDRCDDLMKSEGVTTVEGTMAQRVDVSNAYVECADKCVRRYQKKPSSAPDGDDGSDSWKQPFKNVWREFKEFILEGLYFLTHSKMLWSLVALGLLAVVGWKKGWLTSAKGWLLQMNFPSVESIGARAMEFRLFRRVASITGLGRGGEADALTADETDADGTDTTGRDQPALGIAFWAWTNALLYRGGQVAVYILSASYLPDSVAEYIPWSDAAVRVGAAGVPAWSDHGELEMGLSTSANYNGTRGKTSSAAGGSADDGRIQPAPHKPNNYSRKSSGNGGGSRTFNRGLGPAGRAAAKREKSGSQSFDSYRETRTNSNQSFRRDSGERVNSFHAASPGSSSDFPVEDASQ